MFFWLYPAIKTLMWFFSAVSICRWWQQTGAWHTHFIAFALNLQFGSKLQVSSLFQNMACLCMSDCSLLTPCFAFHVDSHVFVFTRCIAPSVQHVEARQVNADANRFCPLACALEILGTKQPWCNLQCWLSSHDAITHDALFTHKHPIHTPEDPWRNKSSGGPLMLWSLSLLLICTMWQPQ